MGPRALSPLPPRQTGGLTLSPSRGPHLGDCSMTKMSNAAPGVPRWMQAAVTVSMRRSCASRPLYGTTTASLCGLVPG